MNTASTFLVSAAAALLFTRCVTAQSPPRYAVTDLGSLGGAESAATALNNRGQIVGGADTAARGKGPEYVTYVFLWEKGKMRRLSALNGSHAYATAINDAGQMAGAYSPDPLKASFQAARFSGTQIKLLGGFPATVRGFSLSQAEAINAKGQLVGVSNSQAFFWSQGHLRKLAPPTGFRGSEARALNNRGETAGKGERLISGTTRSHAIFWGAGGAARDLGVLPGYTDSVARALSDTGSVVGWVSRVGGTLGRKISFHYQAFLVQNGKMRGLGSIPRIHDSKAGAINSRGQIVGNAYSQSGRMTDEAALLWQNGHVYELAALLPAHSGWQLQNAVGINNSGWIIGNGIHNGIRRAFLLRPVK